jgi:hypothetical protein
MKLRFGFIVLSFFAIVHNVHAALNTACSIDTVGSQNGLDQTKEPLFLSEARQQYTFKIPVNGVLNFVQNERLILACTTDPAGQRRFYIVLRVITICFQFFSSIRTRNDEHGDL